MMFLRTSALLCSLLLAVATPVLPQQEEIRLSYEASIDTTDVTGVFRPSNGALYLKATNASGFADVFLTYGLPGDYPLTGDWNRDGVDTIGIYRNGTFYLRNSNTNGFADIVFAFGAPGDQPVAGDWNGDGITTIGVYRNGTFFLRNSNTSGPPDLVFGLGIAGDIGLTGDWDGDGTVTTGVFRPSNGALYLKNSNTTGFADIVLTYGLPGDLPVAGDWDGDGIDTIGVYRAGTFYLRNSNTNGVADQTFALGAEGDRPIAGHWRLPFVSSLSPAAGHLGGPLSVNVTGRFTNFIYGASQVSFGPGIVVNTVSVYSSTSLTAQISIAEDAVAGTRTPTVTTGAEVARALDGFTVLAGDITPPAVNRTSPSYGDTGVPVNTGVTVEFSERMDPGTLIQANFSIRDDLISQSVAGLVQVEANGRFASFLPNQPFAVGRTFTVTLSSEIKDAAGNRLNPQSFNFATGFVADNNRPSLTGVSPADSDTNIPINSLVVLQFSEPLNVMNAHRGIQVSRGGQVVPGSIYLSDGNRRITFTPQQPLSVNTAFTVTRLALITDLAGNTLTNPASTTFTTGTADDLNYPQVTLVDPASGATGVGTNAVVRIQFSERINPLTVDNATFAIVAGSTGNRVAGTIAVGADRRSAAFTPSSGLPPLTIHSVDISGVADLVGHYISFSSNFTTGADPDTVRPTVVTVSPPPASTGIPVNALVVALFSEPLSASSVAGNAIVLSAGTTPVPGSVALSSDHRRLTFTPANLLAVGNSFTITVSGFTDSAGNAVVPFTSGFRTVPSGAGDNTAPVVTAVDPANAATGVATNSNIVLTFSERIIAGTVNSDTIRISIEGTDSLVAGSYSVSGAVVTFTPSSPLRGSARIRILAYNVLDLAGNGNILFTSFFDTGAVTDTTAPEVILVTPGDGATDVSPNAAVVLTFSEPLHPNTIRENNFALFADGSRLGVYASSSADNRTVTMNVYPLPAASVVTVVVTRDVTDLAGNHLADFQSKFTTAAATDINRPSVVSQRPGNGASGVAVNSSVVLYASEPLKQTSIAGALHISQNGVLVNGTIRVTGTGQAIEFVPAVAWVKNALIQVFLDNNAQDLASNALNNYQGSFRTATDTSASAPAVVRSIPAQGTTGAPLNPVIEVEYNEPLNPATINGTNVALRVGISGNIVASTVSLREGRIIRIVPGAPLAANTSHNYQITTGIRDLDGTAPASAFQASFTTGNSADNPGPHVVSVTPPDGAIEVGINTNIRARFDEPINPLTVSGATIRVSDGTNTVVPCAISFSNGDRDVLLVPHAPLPDARLMTLAVSGVEDRAGHAVTPRTTQFTTRTGPDTTAPVLVRTNPFDGALDVPVNTVITLEVNEPIDPLTVNHFTFQVHDFAAGEVAGSYSVSGDGRIVSFVPDAPLAVGRSVFVSFAGVLDLAGNFLSGYYNYVNFTTAFANDTVGPIAVGVSPANGLTQVPINAQVMIAFNEPVQTLSVDQVTLSAGGVSLSVVRSLTNGNRTLILTPLVLLAPLRVHTVSVAGVRDIAGNLLQTPLTGTFTTGTGADLIPLEATVDPPSGAPGVGTNAVVRIQFSKRINPLTISDTSFVVTVISTGARVAGAIAVAADGRSAVFTPSSGLLPLTNFLVQLFGVTDLTGQGLYSFSTSFATEAGQDTGRPTVVAVSPAPASTGVPVNARVVALLSEPVSIARVGSSAIVLSVGTTLVPGSVVLSSDRRTLTFTPTNLIAVSTALTVTVSGFTDTTGNLVVPFTSSFTTGASGVSDTTAPAVTGVDPANAATGVAVNRSIVLTFSERIAAGTVTDNTIQISIEGIDGRVAGSYSVSGAVVTFAPASPLPGNARIRILVYNVLDLAGNGNNYFSSYFDTGAATDTTAPEVILVTPGDGATDINPNASVVLTFSEPLHPNAIDFSFALFAGGRRLAANVSRSADNRTVTMSVYSLPAASVVTVVATRDVTDLSGNHLADFQSKFTTAAATDINRPSVVSQRPGNGASGVAVNSSVVLYVSEPLKQTTIAGALHISQNGALVNGTIRVTGNGQAIEFVPAAAWVKNALIQVFLDNKAQDSAGNALNNYQGSFRTVSDTSASPPAVVRSVPARLTTGVPLNPVIEVEYNEPLNPGTIIGSNVSLSVSSSGNIVASTVSLREGRIIRIVPGAPLAANTSHIYQITTGIRDLNGTAPTSDFQASFTTGNSVDNASPRVIGVTPPDGAGNVGTNANIRVFFDESINPLTVSDTTIRVSDGTNAVVPCAISFSNADRDVLLVPHAPLPDATLMTLTVSGIEDRAGLTVTPKMTQFRTHTGPDTAAPILLRTNPFDGATVVPVNTVITLEVNEPIDTLTVNSSSFRVFDEVANQVAGSYSVSGDGRIVSFVPDVPLPVGRRVFVSFAGILDLAGNFLSGYNYFSFTTAFAADTAGPQVVGVSPANGWTEVAINAQVMIAFNEPVQTFSVDQVTLSTGGVSLSLVRSFSNGNRTLILTPLVPFAPLKVHTVSIAGVKDIAGNLLQAPVTATFTTGTGADLIPLSATADPADGADEVGTNAVVRIRFSERINPLTIIDTAIVVTSFSTGIRVPGAIAVAADGRSAVFTPSTGLAPLTLFDVELFGFIDLTGQGIFFFRSSFRTGAGPDTVGPTVVSVSPAAASTGVPVNARVVTLLSEPVSASSVVSNAIVLSAGATPVPGQVSLGYDHRTLTFTPTNLLAVSTAFTITVNGFTDTTGNAVVPFTSRFTTGASGVADTTAPVVTAVDPANAATGVAVNRNIILTFSERIAAGTVKNDTVTIYVDGIIGPVAGSYSVSGTVVTFTPASPLPGSARVNIQVSGVLDLAGNSNTFFSSFFDTGSATDTTAPAVILVTPGDGAAGVSPNVAVVLTFSEPLHPSTINDNNLALFAGGGRLFSYINRSADNRTVTMNVNSLPAASVVMVAVTRDVTDIAGNHLADFQSKFTTAAASDINRPSVVSQRPGNGASGASVNSSVVLYVNEPLNQTTIAGALHISQNGVLVNGTIRVTGNGQAIEFVPNSAWVKNALVQVFFDDKAKDMAGNALNNYQGSFRTVSDTSASAPTVVRSVPAQGTTDVPLNPVIEVEYNEPLNPATIIGTNVSLSVSSGGNVVASTVSLREGRIIRIVPGAPLAANTSYNYRITTGIRDLDGTAPTSNFQSSFTTGISADNASPRVIGASPPDGAGNVGTNANIRVFFDESINPITVSGATIRVSDGTNTVVPCAISFSNGDWEVLLVPHAPLVEARLMTLTVSGVEDLAGHPVTVKTTQFTTGTGPDTAAPVVVRANPFYGATDVPVNTVITIEVNEPVDPLTVNSFSFQVYENGAGQVAGSYSVSSDGRTVNFVPNAPLAGARNYTVSSSGGRILDLAGNELAYFFMYFATTAFADRASPRVVGVSPANGFTQVPVNAQVVIAFNEPIQTLTVDQVTLSTGGVSLSVIRSLTNGNRTLTLTPLVFMAPLKVHTVSIAGVKDIAGNLLAAPMTTSFTTGTSVDLNRPSVTIVDPVHGATGVSANAVVRIQFSEPVNPLTIDDTTFLVVANNTGIRVAGAITVAPDGRSAVFTPFSALAPSTTYRVELFTITDFTGIQASFSSYFTTGQ